VKRLLFGDRNAEAIENKLDAYRDMMGSQIPTKAKLEQEWLDLNSVIDEWLAPDSVNASRRF